MMTKIYEYPETPCPRCGGAQYYEIDDGPDTLDDDLYYTSSVCVKCGLYQNGWTDKWYDGCMSWNEIEPDKEYLGS